MENTNADRFLRAFERIESTLKKRLSEPKKPYQKLVGRAASGKVASVNQYQHDLIRFGYLRNAIVHEPSQGGKVIADPRDDTVTRIEHIADRVESPPTVETFCANRPYTASLDDPIGPVVRFMEEHRFSQAPVLDEGKLISLLTTNTVARWLADETRESELNLDAPIKNVLRHRESDENYHVIQRDATLFDAKEAFDVDHTSERPPAAVIITANEDEDGSVIGIITTADLPGIHQQL